MNINNSISLKDNMTPALFKITKAMKSMLSAMESTDSKSKKMFDKAAKDINEANNAVIKLSNNMKNIPSAPDNPFDGWKGNILAINQGLELLEKGFDALNNVIQLGDELTLTDSRIKLIAKDFENVEDIQKSILTAANESRGSYQDMASIVSKLGLLAGDAFSSTQEIIDFTTTLNKAFVVGGAGIQEQTSAMYQLSQAMAAGKLQGDEFRSIMENAPMLAQGIADYMGITKGELKAVASEGVITADIIKGAVAQMATTIDESFENMPTTFGQALTVCKNKLLFMFTPVFTTISKMAASVLNFISNNLDIIAIGLSTIATVGLGALIANMGTLIGLAWGYLAPLGAAVVQWSIMNWPIMLVAGAVGALLTLLLKFPETFSNITGAAGIFGAVVANILKAVYNGFVFLVNGIVGLLNKIPGIEANTLEYATYSNLSDAYDAGKNFGLGLSDKASEMFSGVSVGGGSGSSNSPLGTPDDPLSVTGEVSLTDEDIKLIKDISQYEIVNRYATLSPVVNASFGDIHETADVNGIIDAFVSGVEQAYDSMI